jgi:hypothetical protein
VICLSEQRRAFLGNVLSLDWRRNRAFETLLVTILYFEMVQICRLWDPPETEGYSIPTLAEIADEPGVLALIEAEVTDSIKAPPLEKPALIARAMSNLRQAISEVRIIACDPALNRLRNHRHKHVAHAVLKTYLESIGPIDEPRLADSDEVIARTLELRSVFSSTAKSTYSDFGEDRQTESEAAESFFGALAPAIGTVVPRR